ncbi:MAG: EamA family transporter [Pseudomonadota bacterium]
MKPVVQPGVVAALLAAVLFGAGTPLAKLLLEQTSPWLLAALLYLGSGCGLFLVRLVRRSPAVRLPRSERLWFAGAVLSGGLVAPVLLMSGLSGMSAASVSLLLNAEGVLTALIAWFVFRENFDRRIALGMLAIVAGGVVLSWPGQALQEGDMWSLAAVLAACLAWAVDNNLTRKVSLSDASFVAMVKGLAAGASNLLLALFFGAVWPQTSVMVAAAVLGFASYGASLVLFVLGLRHLGAARTGAYFSLAPFVGAALAIVVLGESLSPALLLAGVLMAWGLYLHLTEKHEHSHRHEPLEHLHEHEHGSDPHHEHAHDPAFYGPVPPGTRHSHLHRHQPLKHRHAHFPDAHHQHSH